MNMQVQIVGRTLGAMAATFALLAATMSASATDGEDDDQGNWLRNPHHLQVDVAEASTRFVFDDAPVFEEDGFPAHGNSFVTQGYISVKQRHNIRIHR